jgi:parallel beta-helix repeat protein
MYNSTDTDSGSTASGLITLNEKSGCKIQNMQIDGNKAAYTRSYNYGIYLSSSSDNTITGNTCNNNSSNGIRFDSSNDNTITGNTCNNNSGNGIRFDSSSNDNTVTGNTCNNNNYSGIYLYSSSSNNTIIGNICKNNDYGIRLQASSNNMITGNTCIRGTGQTSDYTSSQYTIRLQGTNNYNLISLNNCMGKAVVIGGGTGNSAWGNKFDNTDDLP